MGWAEERRHCRGRGCGYEELQAGRGGGFGGGLGGRRGRREQTRRKDCVTVSISVPQGLASSMACRGGRGAVRTHRWRCQLAHHAMLKLLSQRKGTGLQAEQRSITVIIYGASMLTSRL